MRLQGETAGAVYDAQAQDVYELSRADFPSCEEGSMRRHRKARWMVVAGVSVLISGRRRFPRANPSVIVLPMFDMLLLATFTSLAVVLRRNKEAHKRMMLLAYVSILDAAIGRIPGAQVGPTALYALAFLFVIAGMAYDFFSRGRIHKAYIWGGALFLVSVPIRFFIYRTDAWHALAKLLTK
jgi:hypothetical protein